MYECSHRAALPQFWGTVKRWVLPDDLPRMHIPLVKTSHTRVVSVHVTMCWMNAVCVLGSGTQHTGNRFTLPRKPLSCTEAHLSTHAGRSC